MAAADTESNTLEKEGESKLKDDFIRPRHKSNTLEKEGESKLKDDFIRPRHKSNTLEKEGESKLRQSVVSAVLQSNTLEKVGESKLLRHWLRHPSQSNTLEKVGESKSEKRCPWEFLVGVCRDYKSGPMCFIPSGSFSPTAMSGFHLTFFISHSPVSRSRRELTKHFHWSSLISL